MTHISDTRLTLSGERRCDSSETRRLPFGAFQLDARGNVLAYHAGDEEPAVARHELIGRNLFSEIAGDTPVRLWADRFRNGVQHCGLYEETAFRAADDSGPIDVTFIFYYHPQTDTNWVFVQH